MPDFEFLDGPLDGGAAAVRDCTGDADCLSAACLSGQCAPPNCTDGKANGAETDVDCGGKSDCPRCLTGQKCAAPEDCASGVCTAGSCALVCLEGKGDCDGDPTNGCETNLKTTTEHCGACGAPCSLPHAMARCTGGACVVDTCQAPFEDCDGDPKNGCEVNTSSDANNCTGCGKVCPAVNGVPSCTAGACQITCADGFADCDGDLGNGCETNTTKDVNHCGGCGTVCDGKNGTPWCKEGKCGISDCPPGFGDCNGDASDGCEADLSKDTGNCKTCGTACVVANGTGACVASTCKVGTCATGYADCDAASPGGYTNGCETNVAGDLANCGGCGQPCSIANAAAKCEGGACKVKSCTAPFADCNGDGLDCETDTSTSRQNCGGCGIAGVSCDKVYGALNGSGKCVAGGCQLEHCVGNFADCNMQPDIDGCEADLQSSKNNCGACGTVCQSINGANACVLAVCKPTCNANFDSCDGDPNDGCETDKRTSKSNCGACGAVCLDNNTQSNECMASACKPVCATGYDDCDTSRVNGCETPVSADPANCGACRVACGLLHASATDCTANKCTPTCDDGWGACGDASLGCDTSLDSTVHCGSCAIACTGATPFCIGRTCKSHLDIVVVNDTTNGSGTTSVTLHHALATPAGNHRLVLLGIGSLGNSATQAAPTSVVYGSVNMQLAHATWSQNQAWAGIYYLDDATLPATPPAAGVDVVVSGSSSAIEGHLIELKNVEQAIAYMTTTRPVDGDTGSYNNCSTAHPDDSLTLGTDGSYLFSTVGYFSTSVSTTTAAYPLQTKSTATPDPFANQLGVIAGWRGPLTAGAQHIGWNMSGCNKYGHTVVGVRPTVTP
jgi:hypothetical protein